MQPNYHTWGWTVNTGRVLGVQDQAVPGCQTKTQSSAVLLFPTTHPRVKCHLLSPLFPHRSIPDRKSRQSSSRGGAHSLSPLGYHLETPNRDQITGNHPPLTHGDGSATAHQSLHSGRLQGTLLYLREEQKTMCVCIFSIIQLASFCRSFVASFHHP